MCAAVRLTKDLLRVLRARFGYAKHPMSGGSANDIVVTVNSVLKYSVRRASTKVNVETS
jgi:hypothetical protein